MAIMYQWWMISSGPFPKATRTVVNKGVGTIPERAASVLNKYHIDITSRWMAQTIKHAAPATCSPSMKYLNIAKACPS
jgi:hypothetical protein